MAHPPLITVAVQCHYFQRRLCWMLSTLAQQTEPEHVAVDIAFMPGNGNPSTETVIEQFGHLKIVASVWTDYSRFQKRGLVRTRNLQECQTDWLLFSDCDMLFHPEYFARLVPLLRSDYRQATHMLSAGRMVIEKAEANELVENTPLKRSLEVSNAYSRVSRLSLDEHPNIGAGNFQLIHHRHAPHGHYYVTPEENMDQSWDERWQKAHSDVQFRHRLAEAGGERVSLPRWFTENLIHLNHHRDNEFGRHLEDQR